VPKIIDSQALGVLNRALGVTGSSATQTTELEDGKVFQTLDITGVARRGRTQGNTGGLYRGLLRNIHTDAETLTSTIDPYNAGANATSPYPPAMPQSFDVWLLGACVTRLSGGGTFTGSLKIEQVEQGWGVDDSAAAVVAEVDMVVAFWNAINAGSATPFGVTQTREPWKRLGIRIPRRERLPTAGIVLTFDSTSSLTATFDCSVMLGVFPAGFGQDGL